MKCVSVHVNVYISSSTPIVDDVCFFINLIFPNILREAVSCQHCKGMSLFLLLAFSYTRTPNASHLSLILMKCIAVINVLFSSLSLLHILSYQLSYKLQLVPGPVFHFIIVYFL